MERLPKILLDILHARGLSGEALDDYLNPSLRQLQPPGALPGIDEAAAVILAGVAERRKTVVFGDYDCDGICATAILVKTINALFPESRVEPFLPERVAEGYGMSEKSVERLLATHPDLALLITVDNGINSVEHVAALRERGIRVVVTDHHLPGPELPKADALVNPKVAAPAPFESLCGAGIAFLLARKLAEEAKARGLYAGPNLGGEPLVLAALATVTDIMPLLGQNRAMLAAALERFHAWAPVGLRELHARAARQGAAKLSSRDFAFLLGPRINAAGRMASGTEALALILEDDREKVRALARLVDRRNDERKQSEQKMTRDALEKIVPDAAAQVIDLPDGDPGVAGIVAARILESLEGSGPVCVIAGGHGSARAPAGFNLREAFDACRAHLRVYGGHAAAGGFAVRDGATDAFRRALCAYAQALREKGSFAPAAAKEPERWLEPNDLTLELARAIRLLEPFGEANEEPLFGLRGQRLFDIRAFGSGGKHLSFVVEAPAAGGAGTVRGVWWGRGEKARAFNQERERPRDILFNLRVSDFGDEHIELHIVDVRESTLA